MSAGGRPTLLPARFQVERCDEQHRLSELEAERDARHATVEQLEKEKAELEERNETMMRRQAEFEGLAESVSFFVPINILDDSGQP